VTHRNSPDHIALRVERGRGTRRREPPSIYLASCHPCRVSGVWGQGVWTPRICDFWGSLHLRGAGLIRPHSVAPFPLLGNSTGASTRRRPSQQAHQTLVGRPLLEEVSHNTDASPSHRWTPTSRRTVWWKTVCHRCRRTTGGVSPAVSSETGVHSRRLSPHALGDGWAVSDDRAGARHKGEISVSRYLGVARPSCFQAVPSVQTWKSSGDGDCLSLDLVMREGEIVGQNVHT